MKGIIYSCIFTLTGLSAMAQGGNSLQPTDPNLKPAPKVVVKKPKPIHREFSFGIKLNTDGWGIFVDRGTVKTNDKYPERFYAVRLLQIEFSEHRSPAEIKRTNTLSSGSSAQPTPFIYGKVNNFYALKIGYGNRKMIAGKPETGNVSVHWVYLGGLSLGLLKPYYIEANVKDASGNYVIQSTKYSEKNKEDFLNKNNIIGSSGFAKGLGEIQFSPGIQLKTALHFDFAASKHAVFAVEAGASLDYHFSAVQIMANKDAQSMFLGAYLSVQFGKRW